MVSMTSGAHLIADEKITVVEFPEAVVEMYHEAGILTVESIVDHQVYVLDLSKHKVSEKDLSDETKTGSQEKMGVNLPPAPDKATLESILKKVASSSKKSLDAPQPKHTREDAGIIERLKGMLSPPKIKEVPKQLLTSASSVNFTEADFGAENRRLVKLLDPQIVDTVRDNKPATQIRKSIVKQLRTAKDQTLNEDELVSMIAVETGTTDSKVKEHIQTLAQAKAIVVIDVEPEPTLDINQLEGVIPASRKGKIVTLLEVLKEMEETIKGPVPKCDLIENVKQKGVPADAVERLIQEMKMKGDIFEPRSGYIQKL